jgi:hypothetical protein
MPQRTICPIVTLFALALVSSTFVLAQSTNLSQVVTIPAHDSWQVARQIGSSKGKIIVVTLAQPQRRQTCRIRSFTLDKLVCSRAIGGPRTYLPQQILALILPGDGDVKLRLVRGLNAGVGAAIWGTVVLAATCPACAVATGIVALLLFGAAGAILIGDDRPDSLFYLAPGQQLAGKLRSLQP